MPRISSAIAMLLVASICLGACSSGSGTSPGDGGRDVASESGNDITCQGIRICVAMCNDTDQACRQACVARGSAGAQTTFQALATCTAGLCSPDDFNCACQQQCFAEGSCLAEVDTCVAGAVDDLACGYCR